MAATRRLKAWAVLLGALAFGAAVYVVTPGETPLPPCPFHFATGLYCPGCGTVRGLHQLLHGNLAAAWRCNPLMILLLPIMLYETVFRSAAAVLGRSARQLAMPAVCSWLIVGVVTVYWIARNVPAYPFCLLAPR